MRTPMVAGNWKMNKTLYETRDLIREMYPVCITYRASK